MIHVILLLMIIVWEISTHVQRMIRAWLLGMVVGMILVASSLVWIGCGMMLVIYLRSRLSQGWIRLNSLIFVNIMKDLGCSSHHLLIPNKRHSCFLIFVYHLDVNVSSIEGLLWVPLWLILLMILVYLFEWSKALIRVLFPLSNLIRLYPLLYSVTYQWFDIILNRILVFLWSSTFHNLTPLELINSIHFRKFKFSACWYSIFGYSGLGLIVLSVYQGLIIIFYIVAWRNLRVVLLFHLLFLQFLKM